MVAMIAYRVIGWTVARSCSVLVRRAPCVGHSLCVGCHRESTLAAVVFGWYSPRCGDSASNVSSAELLAALRSPDVRRSIEFARRRQSSSGDRTVDHLEPLERLVRDGDGAGVIAVLTSDDRQRRRR